MAAGGQLRSAWQVQPEVGMWPSALAGGGPTGIRVGKAAGAGSEWKERPQGGQLRKCSVITWIDRQVSKGKSRFAGWEIEEGPLSDCPRV